jgi:hypothetical protein
VPLPTFSVSVGPEKPFTSSTTRLEARCTFRRGTDSGRGSSSEIPASVSAVPKRVQSACCSAAFQRVTWAWVLGPTTIRCADVLQSLDAPHILLEQPNGRERAIPNTPFNSP